jgi:diamine N-acetyltransferase
MTDRIELREVTRANWKECIALGVTAEQTAGDFVSPNVYSLAEASFHPFVPRAIYRDDQMVGFAMWLEHDEGDGLEWFGSDSRPEYWISRFMIDAAHQGRGYGRRSLEIIIEEMRRAYHCKEINLTYNDANIAAAKLYASFGFQVAGRAPWNETLAQLAIES